MIIEYPAQIQAVIADLATDPGIRSLAAEPALEVTRHSYGYYLTQLTTLATRMPVGLGDQRSEMTFWADVLIAAGAHPQGVRDALLVAS